MLDLLKKSLNPGKENLLLAYALFALGLCTSMAFIAAIILLYINKNEAKGVYASHYKFMLRTIIIGAILSILCLYLQTSGLIGNMLTGGFGFAFLSYSLGSLIYLAIIVWLAARAIIALRYLLNDEAHPNPSTLFIK